MKKFLVKAIKYFCEVCFFIIIMLVSIPVLYKMFFMLFQDETVTLVAVGSFSGIFIGSYLFSNK